MNRYLSGPLILGLADRGKSPVSIHRGPPVARSCAGVESSGVHCTAFCPANRLLAAVTYPYKENWSP